jgi:predicted TIM-barrel fold metal-dependent hydrolase
MVPRIADVEAADLDDTMSAELDRAGVVGVRFLTWNPGSGNPIELEREKLTADIERGKFDRALGIAAERGLTVFIYANGMLEQAAALASRWPDTQFVVDHLGILQPPMEVPEEPRFRSLPKLLGLSERGNVAVKFCGLPGLSKEAYPFRDVHDAARQITDAFGADRLMWGSDIWRFRGRIGYKYRIPGTQGSYPGKHTYAESVGFIRDTEIFDESEKALLLGGTARALLKWDGETNTGAGPN